MDVTIIGCGYVGLVTGTCLAAIGHTVRGVEKDAKKLKTLQDGHCPIFEPGLQELMQENYASGQLQLTHDVKAAVKDADLKKGLVINLIRRGVSRFVFLKDSGD